MSKGQKGITLVALVITIIVLLILAGVSISVLTNTNILGNANNAVTKYNAEATKTDNLIEQLDNLLQKWATD